jgi:hypothetical protein
LRALAPAPMAEPGLAVGAADVGSSTPAGSIVVDVGETALLFTVSNSATTKAWGGRWSKIQRRARSRFDAARPGPQK